MKWPPLARHLRPFFERPLAYPGPGAVWVPSRDVPVRLADSLAAALPEMDAQAEYDEMEGDPEELWSMALARKHVPTARLISFENTNMPADSTSPFLLLAEEIAYVCMIFLGSAIASWERAADFRSARSTTDRTCCRGVRFATRLVQPVLGQQQVPS